jgi:hypothetical protein
MNIGVTNLLLEFKNGFETISNIAKLKKNYQFNWNKLMVTKSK